MAHAIRTSRFRRWPWATITRAREIAAAGGFETVEAEHLLVALTQPTEVNGRSAPTWSSDGERIAWLANGVGSRLGPAILVYADSGDVPFGPIPIAGNEDRPFDRFPAFPDW